MRLPRTTTTRFPPGGRRLSAFCWALSIVSPAPRPARQRRSPALRELGGRTGSIAPRRAAPPRPRRPPAAEVARLLIRLLPMSRLNGHRAARRTHFIHGPDAARTSLFARTERGDGRADPTDFPHSRPVPSIAERPARKILRNHRAGRKSDWNRLITPDLQYEAIGTGSGRCGDPTALLRFAGAMATLFSPPANAPPSLDMGRNVG